MMKFLYPTVLIVLVFQQVSSSSEDDDIDFLQHKESRPFYESPHWKQSLAYDAPVISPKETLEHLKALEPLLPRDKNIYIPLSGFRGNTEEMFDENNPEFHTNAVYGVMEHEFDQLINFQNLVNKDNCLLERFEFLYHIDQNENYFVHPQKRLRYGPNIEAYLNHYRKQLLDICRDEMQNNEDNISSGDMDLVKAVAGRVKSSGIDAAGVDYAAEDGSLAAAINKYMKANGGLKKRNLKDKLTSIMAACVHTVNELQPNGFYDIALNRPVVSDYIRQDEFLNKWALKIKMCRAIHGKIAVEDLLADIEGDKDDDNEDNDDDSSTGHKRGHFKNLFHRH